MAHNFAVLRSSTWFRALFDEPKFRLLADLPALSARLFADFSPYGLRLSDLRYRAGESHLGETCLECRIAQTAIHIFLDRVEGSSTAPARERDTLFSDAVAAVKDHLPSVKIGSYSYTLGLHGVAEGVKSEDFVARFAAQAPQRLGPLFGSSTQFYFGSDGNRLASTLTLGMSDAAEEGLLVQVEVHFAADRIELAQVHEAARGYLAEALAELGLALGG